MSLKETPRITARFGSEDPSSVDLYRADGGFNAVDRLNADILTADDILNSLEDSGLRGRGGAGFSTGRKWRSVAEASGTRKYVIANCDEGDPGAFMDRSLLENDPLSVMEGMIIAGLSVGAHHGIMFIREEYRAAREMFERALANARAAGYLGPDAGNLPCPFDITVVRSGGNYLLGESSALVDALENRVGNPRPKPPHLFESGLWGCPTLVNNVETFANVPFIAVEGAQAYRSLGTAESPGTKLLCVTGGKSKAGLIEVPMGTDLMEIAGHFAPEGLDGYKAVQVGGPSGAVLPLQESMPLDFDSLESAGGIMGSGGVVLIADDDCLVELTRYYIAFCRMHSCERCRSCREGLKRCEELLEGLVNGVGSLNDLDELTTLAKDIPAKTLCGLGKASTRMLESALRYFRSEFEEHARGGCPALRCKKLIRYRVIADKCPGCRCCLYPCPTRAIRGKMGRPFSVDDTLCDRCNACIAACPYDAIEVIPANAGSQKP